MFDDKFFLVIGGGMLSWLAAWFIKVVWDRNNEVREQIREVRKELAEFKQEVKKDFQSKELASQMHHTIDGQMGQILKKLESIDAKLDKKADK